MGTRFRELDGITQPIPSGPSLDRVVIWNVGLYLLVSAKERRTSPRVNDVLKSDIVTSGFQIGLTTIGQRKPLVIPRGQCPTHMHSYVEAHDWFIAAIINYVRPTQARFQRTASSCGLFFDKCEWNLKSSSM